MVLCFVMYTINLLNLDGVAAADQGAECAEEPGGVRHLDAGARQLPYRRVSLRRPADV